ncbi:hypothetical protein ACH4D3_13120 [Streptomyces sp. NPDC018026]|uniref:hypothetical protein n=1 Tax=Streptomyces sp. NPDC018026 TaxID=3365031 RepID=UPI0037BA7A5A
MPGETRNGTYRTVLPGVGSQLVDGPEPGRAEGDDVLVGRDESPLRVKAAALGDTPCPLTDGGKRAV